jgi:hypothetical protein
LSDELGEEVSIIISNIQNIISHFMDIAENNINDDSLSRKAKNDSYLDITEFALKKFIWYKNVEMIFI